MNNQEMQQAGGGSRHSTTPTTNFSGYNSTPTSTTTTSPLSSANQCPVCSSTKRRSPSLSSDFQEQPPATKKPNRHHHLPSSSTITTTTQSPQPQLPPLLPPHLHGYTHLPLPFIPSTTTTLHRSISSPVPSPQFLNPQSPQERPLLRSISDPSSSTYPAATTTSAATPQPSKLTRTNTLHSPSSGINKNVHSGKPETTTAKRLKKIKELIKEMSEWCDQVMGEDEHTSEDEGSENPVDDSETETNDQEAVSVERSGDYLIVNFKCPCGKGYQILLSQKYCYYKLM